MPGDVNLTRRQILLLKTETTYGVDADPTEANSFEAIKLTDNFALDPGQEFIEVQGGNLTRGFQKPIPTVRPFGVTFRSYVHGLGTGSYDASNKPALADGFRACGLFETLVASNADGVSEYQYAPAAAPESDTSVTIVANQDGKDHRLLGCRGNMNLIYQAAAPAIAEFTFRGLLSTEAETTRAVPSALPDVIPPRWIDSGAITVGSLVADMENFNLNTNNQLMEHRASSADSGSGIVQILITERTPGGSFDPAVTRIASHDFIAQWRSASESVIQLNCGIDTTNRFTLTLSNAVYKQVGWGDNTGLSIFNTDYQAYERNGNDEFRLTFVS